MFYRLYSKRLHTQYKPESKTVADNTGINVGKIVFTYCSPLSIVVDFQTSHGSQDTPAQSDFDIWTSSISHSQLYSSCVRFLHSSI